MKTELFSKGNYLKFSPPSAIVYCSPSLSPETKFFKWLTSSTCHSSSSVYLLKGSRFNRRLPENNTGSCWENILRLLRVWAQIERDQTQGNVTRCTKDAALTLSRAEWVKKWKTQAKGPVAGKSRDIEQGQKSLTKYQSPQKTIQITPRTGSISQLASHIQICRKNQRIFEPQNLHCLLTASTPFAPIIFWKEKSHSGHCQSWKG